MVRVETGLPCRNMMLMDLSINLSTVKVQNWDKTITTIPTYAFITDSFKTGGE
jgi:hypothetical protein